MYTVPLEPVPNQRLTVRLDGALFEITLKQARETMTITIVRDGEPLIRGQRCLPEAPLIPYRHLEGRTGNFHFHTGDGQYPQYTRFGGTDELWYVTREELEELRHG